MNTLAFEKLITDLKQDLKIEVIKNWPTAGSEPEYPWASCRVVTDKRLDTQKPRFLRKLANNDLLYVDNEWTTRIDLDYWYNTETETNNLISSVTSFFTSLDRSPKFERVLKYGSNPEDVATIRILDHSQGTIENSIKISERRWIFNIEMDSLTTRSVKQALVKDIGLDAVISENKRDL